MKQFVSDGIILARTDYGEADRIITVLTPEQGKLRLVAKGVRRAKSKLAGGIELFSVSTLTYIPGRGSMGTVISTRLQRHYGNIVKQIERTMLGYELIKRLNRVTEDAPEPEYYALLEQAFAALDDSTIDATLIALWFDAQLLMLGGHQPNLSNDVTGQKLTATARYDFSLDDTAMLARPDGTLAADDIKFLRLVFAGNQPAVLQKISGLAERIDHTSRLVRLLAKQLL